MPELNVNYSYSYKGEEHLGNKLVIDGVDPSDQYLYKLKKMLDLADKDSKAMSVWINPEKPSQSVVDKSLRWRGLDFFIALFIGTAVLGYSGVVEILRSVFFFINPRLHKRLRQKAFRKQTKTTTLYDRDSTIAPIGWGFALFLFLPLYLGGFRFALLALIDGNIVLGLVPLILGGAFIGILVYAAIKAKVFSKTINLGAVKLVVKDYPLQVGGSLSCFCKIVTSRLPDMAAIEMRVGCDQYDQRKVKTKKKKLWLDKSEAKISTDGRYSYAQFDFEIPNDLPSVENEKAVKVDWWVELSVTGHQKEKLLKRYGNLGVFQTDPEKIVLNEKRLKNNVVTKPGLFDFSTIFLTNGALLFGIFVFDWSVMHTLMGILVETAFIALLSPFLLIGLPKKSVATRVESEESNGRYSVGFGIGRSILNFPFVLGLLTFQAFIINFFFDLQFADLVANNNGVLFALLHFIGIHNLWLSIAAVFISMFFEWRKLSRKSTTVNIDQLKNNITGAPLLRMFFTTFIMVSSLFFTLNLDSGDGLQVLLLIIVAFKLWIEYSLVRWGRLEI